MTGVVARWAGRRGAGAVGLLAVVVDMPVGRRLVIAERADGGGWAPARVVEATAEAVRMIGRQGEPAAADGDGRGGRLW